MTMVPAGNAGGWFVTWVGIDRNNDVARAEFELMATVPADAISQGAAMVLEWEALTQCETVARHISQRYEEDAIVVPSAGERQTKAVITLRLEGGNEKAVLEIPAPVETLFVALTGDNNKIVNTVHAGLVAFVDNFKTTEDNIAMISDGEHVAEILRGRKR